MWTKIRYGIVLFFCTGYSYAHYNLNQDWVDQIDSLKTQLKLLKMDTTKVHVYLELSYHFMGNNTQMAIDYADSALRLSSRLNYALGEAQANNRLGLAFELEKSHNRALEHVNLALTTHKKIKDWKWIALDLNVLGIIYRSEGKFHKSIDTYEQLLETIPEGEMTSIAGLAYSNMGMAYFDLKQEDSAQYYYEVALKILNQHNHKRETAFVLDNLATLSISQKDFEKAIEYLVQAIEINQKEGNFIELGNNYVHLVKVHIEAGDNQKALYFLDHASELSSKYQLAALMKEVLTYYKVVYVKMNNYEEAYEYSEKERMLSDSLLSQAQTIQIANLRKVHEFERLHDNLLESDQKVKMQQRMLYIFVTGAFLLLALIYLLLKFFRNKVKSNEALAQLNSEMMSQSEKLKKANEQIKKMNENLERLIGERTEELQKQNEKLIEYANFNAHEIRGPMARLSGLLNLSKNYPEGIEDKDFLNKVFEAIVELEQKVEEISRVFKEENPET